ncbi:hypothetical protein K466DRAFT_311988 [Polyporus arcularius HHB13444]|uniref:Secreted protein n=1 Tax=Polyporus arcularius HHB13444 TaxID=1314778 RepID=A0A5C3P8M1_9APHY|nr:hypothetical protein K466DRAFT_311988 [Polyporus arcularius HHB13444]
MLRFMRVSVVGLSMWCARVWGRSYARVAYVASLYVSNGTRYHIVSGCNGGLVSVHVPPSSTRGGCSLPIYHSAPPLRPWRSRVSIYSKEVILVQCQKEYKNHIASRVHRTLDKSTSYVYQGHLSKKVMTEAVNRDRCQKP